MTITETAPTAMTIPATPTLVERFGAHEYCGDGEGFDGLMTVQHLDRLDAVDAMIGSARCEPNPVMSIALTARGVITCAA